MFHFLREFHFTLIILEFDSLTVSFHWEFHFFRIYFFRVSSPSSKQLKNLKRSLSLLSISMLLSSRTSWTVLVPARICLKVTEDKVKVRSLLSLSTSSTCGVKGQKVKRNFSSSQDCKWKTWSATGRDLQSAIVIIPYNNILSVYLIHSIQMQNI